MSEIQSHPEQRILALDAGSTTIRASWFSQNGSLEHISTEEFGNPCIDLFGSRVIPPQAWMELATRLQKMGKNADQIVVTGASKNPIHMRNKKGESFQILGGFHPRTEGLNVEEATYKACQRRPEPGQIHYAATKLSILMSDVEWQQTLGIPEQVGSRIGAFVAAVLGMMDTTIIAKPDRPGWTLDGGSIESLQRVLYCFGFNESSYQAPPKQFTHKGIEVYTAGDIVENLTFYNWLIQQGVIDPASIMFEGDTYAKIIRQTKNQGDILRTYLEGMHYDKEAMGAAINALIVPAFESFWDKHEAARDYNYPYRFVSIEAAKQMKYINESPYYLLSREKPILLVESEGGLQEISFSDLPQDLPTLALAASSCYVSSAINTTSHISPETFRKPIEVHAYSGWYREVQPAALMALCGVLPENANVYLDEIPDSAGVAVINSRISAGSNINPHQFVTLKPMKYHKNCFTNYIDRWNHVNDFYPQDNK